VQKEINMKIRNGFVSNSSSSSFVICKEFLTNKQIKAIEKWYNEERDLDISPGDNGDYFNEDDNYISAEVRNVYEEFKRICEKNKIDWSKMFWIEG